jgi:hypothetical protein
MDNCRSDVTFVELGCHESNAVAHARHTRELYGRRDVIIYISQLTRGMQTTARGYYAVNEETESGPRGCSDVINSMVAY